MIFGLLHLGPRRVRTISTAAVRAHWIANSLLPTPDTDLPALASRAATSGPRGAQRWAAFDPPPWHARALCKSDAPDDEAYFGVEEVGRSLPMPVVARTRATCAQCPVRRECLTWAMENEERYGIWAGTTGRDRERMRAKVRNGSPVLEIIELAIAAQS